MKKKRVSTVNEEEGSLCTTKGVNSTVYEKAEQLNSGRVEGGVSTVFEEGGCQHCTKIHIWKRNCSLICTSSLL